MAAAARLDSLDLGVLSVVASFGRTAALARLAVALGVLLSEAADPRLWESSCFLSGVRWLHSK